MSDSSTDAQLPVRDRRDGESGDGRAGPRLWRANAVEGACVNTQTVESSGNCGTCWKRLRRVGNRVFQLHRRNVRTAGTVPGRATTLRHQWRIAWISLRMSKSLWNVRALPHAHYRTAAQQAVCSERLPSSN